MFGRLTPEEDEEKDETIYSGDSIIINALSRGAKIFALFVQNVGQSITGLLLASVCHCLASINLLEACRDSIWMIRLRSEPQLARKIFHSVQLIMYSFR